MIVKLDMEMGSLNVNDNIPPPLIIRSEITSGPLCSKKIDPPPLITTLENVPDIGVTPPELPWLSISKSEFELDDDFL